MSTETHRGVVRGGTIVLQGEDAALCEGTEVLIVPLGAERGSPAAVLAAANAPPQIPAGWVDELDQLIAEGRRPPARPDPFAGDADGAEKP
jgi:hypothetical protein